MDQMLTAQDGMLLTSQVVLAGISKPAFYDYVRSGDFDRVAHCWEIGKQIYKA